MISPARIFLLRWNSILRTKRFWDHGCYRLFVVIQPLLPGYQILRSPATLKALWISYFVITGNIIFWITKPIFLGDEVSDYGKPELNNEMREALYELQVHIYKVV